MAKSNFIVRGGADFSGIKKGLDQTQKQLSNFQNGVNKSMKIVGVALAGLATGKFIKDSTKMAMGVESAMDNISRNMGSSSAVFNRWAETQSKTWGMARADAYKYGSTFSNLLGSFITDAQTTSSETQNLMKAAAIISSKTGRTYDDTANRIRSGMLGSTEAIEDLGIYTQISMLESTDAFKKFANGKTWAQLDFQVQQQIRLAAILEQAYERYGDTLADTTQTRQAMFIASLKNIQLNLGQAFLPIYNAVLPLLTALANKLEAVTNKLRYFTQAIFGKAIAGPAAQTEEQGAAISGIGDAAETAGDQTKKAAKDIKGAVAGFDEINSLTDKKADSSGGEMTGVGGAAPEVLADVAIGEDAEVSPAIQKSIDKLLALLEPLKAINLDNLKSAFDNLKVALAPITTALFAGLHWAYLNLFVPLAKWTIEDALPAFLGVLSGALKVISAVLDALKPLGMWLWENFLKPLASWTGGAIVKILGKLGEGLSGIGDWISEHQGVVQTFAIIAGSFAAAWGLVNLAIGVWNVVGAIAAGVTTAFGAAVAFLTSPIGLVILAIGAVIAIIVILVKHWDEVKLAAQTVWLNIVNVWGKASNWFSTKVLEPIKNAFKGAINFLIGLAEGFVNGFINGINAIIKALNKIKFDIPDWVPGIGGKSFGININPVKTIEIPRLAQGGITNGPMMAMIGDNPGGKEVVSPLDDLTDIIASAVGSAVMGAMQFAGSGSDRGGDIILNLDGKEFARATLSNLNKESSRLGYRPILQTR